MSRRARLHRDLDKMFNEVDNRPDDEWSATYQDFKAIWIPNKLGMSKFLIGKKVIRLYPAEPLTTAYNKAVGDLTLALRLAGKAKNQGYALVKEGDRIVLIEVRPN